MKKKIILLFFLLLVSSITALRINGKDFAMRMDFEPGKVYRESFEVVNEEGFTASYTITPSGPFAEYMTITPEKISNVPHGQGKPFEIRIDFPETFDGGGETINRATVEIDNSGSGGIRAVPSISIKYLIFVPYPFKYLKWSFSVPNYNINETKEMTISLKNIGEPTVDVVYADIAVINLETNQTIASLKTNTEKNITSRQSRTLSSEFSTFNMDPGNYKAIANLYWDTNISTLEMPFRVGSKLVDILNFTRLFEKDAINKMDIRIESKWNTEIKDIYADINIQDLEEKKVVHTFKSLNDQLDPWQKKDIVAYFDTSGLEKEEYLATIILRYEGAKTTISDNIRIGENINAVTVDEIPGKFSLKSMLSNISFNFTLMHFFILLLIVFILLLLYLIYNQTGSKKKETKDEKEEEADIDPNIISHVKEMKKKYTDDYIKEIMIKKGWPKNRVEEILKRLKK